MTVCKFFQQGYCRYGQNCRYDHIYGSKYSYHASPQPQAVPPPPQVSGVTDEQLLNQVQSDVQSALRGGQWLLSCYSPFKEKPIFPGISDLSPEEARLFIYEAKANNNVDQAVSYMNNLFKEAREKYEQLLKPNLHIIKVLKSLYKGETVSSPFGATQNSFNNTATGNTASSLFRSAVQTVPFNQTAAQNTAQSIFNQAQNIIFNSQPQDPAKDIFSRANTNTFQTNQNAPSPFASQNAAKSIFASAAQNAFNTNQSSPSSIFAAANQTMFAKEPSQSPSPFSQNNVFQNDNRVSGFGQSNVIQSEDSGVYSKMEDLIEDDLKAFKSDSFQLGFVPETPPPYSLC